MEKAIETANWLAPRIVSLDRVHVRVLVDNVTDSLSSNPPFVQSEWAGLREAGMTVLDGQCVCCACHGLSLVITAEANGQRRSLIFDGGPDGYALHRNGTHLGIDFGAIDAAVLSHGHWDHAGGLLTALTLIREQNNGRDLPTYVHPDMFRQRAVRYPDGSILPHKPIPSTEELTRQGASVISHAAATLLLDEFFYLSGEIPRVTQYERGYPPHLRRTADGTAWEPDPLIMDERFLAVRVRDKGLIVFTACSHAGVVNVLKHARALFPDIPLYAVVGGLHLSGTTEALIPPTVRDLAEFRLTHIIPMHCTGWRAVNALVTAFGEAVVVPAAVGKGVSF
ncbi:MAG: MBL fold metallo-hydrolase [Hyphomicrobiaceae bacterium]|nr:MAG: MBL fold metallo-hydrolase [Hyphomicrobiaceae bacterium]